MSDLLLAVLLQIQMIADFTLRAGSPTERLEIITALRTALRRLEGRLP
jgi:hypothetical protein